MILSSYVTGGTTGDEKERMRDIRAMSGRWGLRGSERFSGPEPPGVREDAEVPP